MKPDAMLRAGMVIRTHDGRVVVLMGRNGCNRWMWCRYDRCEGHRLKPNGTPDTNTMPVVAEKDVAAVRVQGEGFQGVLPGIFG